MSIWTGIDYLKFVTTNSCAMFCSFAQSQKYLGRQFLPLPLIRSAYGVDMLQTLRGSLLTASAISQSCSLTVLLALLQRNSKTDVCRQADVDCCVVMWQRRWSTARATSTRTACGTTDFTVHDGEVRMTCTVVATAASASAVQSRCLSWVHQHLLTAPQTTHWLSTTYTVVFLRETIKRHKCSVVWSMSTKLLPIH